METQYSLSSDDCELLLAFERAQSVARLAELRGRDVSVVSRQISRLGARMDVLEKQNGQWQLTTLGRQMCEWARRSIQEQRQLLDQVQTLRIATTPEFAARVLAPGLPDLLKLVGGGSGAQIEVLSSDDRGIERKLLAGDADLAFDCGRPESPSIKFKLLSREPLALAASPQFLKEHPIRSLDDLVAAPHVRYTRLSTTFQLRLPGELRAITATFDTIAGARAAAVSGLGWVLLPTYTLQSELDAKRLKLIPGSAIPQLSKIDEEQFGVWWLRGNRSVEPWAQAAIAWLAKQKLGE